MPSIRRSTRIQKKKSSQTLVEAQNDAKKSKCKVNSPLLNIKTETESDQEETQECIACKQKHPPIRRYPQNHWIQCDNCDEWWHVECACVTREDKDRLTRYNISYSCALCILKGSPWIQSNHDLSAKSPNVNVNSSCKQENDDKEIRKNSVKVKESKKVSFSLPEQGNIEKKSGNIIVVDNIKEAQTWKSSKTIKEKLKSFPELNSVAFAYSLPRGGIALHCSTDKETDEILENWPGKVFSDQEKPHRPKEESPCCTGYLKNIDIRVKDSQLREFLNSKNCKVLEVRKIFHRNSGRPMPIRRVNFATNSDLLKALTIEYPFKLNGKEAFCEQEKRHKVVRCFSCHRFNHIAANCIYKSKCENCGSEEHTFPGDCTSPSTCANCGGNHKCSSKICPKYIEIIQKVRKNNIL